MTTPGGRTTKAPTVGRHPGYVSRVCAWCGERFGARRSDATYCRDAHRKAAARARP